MRRLLATAAATALLPAGAIAQDRVTLWDVFSLDRIAQSLAQSGIQMLRTQMDLKYGDLSVDLRRSRATMSDITAWPFFDWDENFECEIGIDRITLLTTPIDTVERFKLTARVSGLTLQPACLPEEAREGLQFVGLDTIEVPRMTIDINYGMPASDALIHIFADVTDVATLDVTGDFAYFWFDGRDDMEQPEPVWFLDSAVLEIENRGIWEAVKDQLPPPITGEGAALTIEGMLGDALIDLNRKADPETSSMTDDQRAFVKSAAEAWPAFLASPETLVLETGIDGDVYIDMYAIEDDPRELFTALRPRVALAPARTSELLSVDLLTRASGDAADALSDEEKLQVGEALILGTGAPRNVAKGMDLLQPLAEGGSGAAALLVAKALLPTEPDAAYLWALRAGAAGETGATALLDRLEKDMAFTRVLELQAEISGSDEHPGSALRTLSGIREQATMRMSGNGLARSYGIAAMWAILAKAAGDPEASAIVDEIDELVRLEGAEARAAWAETESAYADLAMEVWIGQNLPARYAE
ncbi:hypothetical protein [Pseudoruegeria sp. HB172150]|uniref:hypothetical protein n=1 Tax=Pseudoruegeria sp. HB172150 TaxID=2721164 RepID=UPI001552F781|nr:hypothetical protein [Pseudoruegeria sp. HB172150]